MKVFVALFVVALAASSFALTDEQKKLVQERSALCMKESGATPEDVQNVKKGIFSGKPELAKFAYCFLKASDLIDEHSVPKPDVIKQKLGADLGDQIDKLLAACKNPSGDTKEAKAAAFYKCYYENSDKHVPFA